MSTEQERSIDFIKSEMNSWVRLQHRAESSLIFARQRGGATVSGQSVRDLEETHAEAGHNVTILLSAIRILEREF